MILGHGANTMTMDEARAKLCAEAKILGRDCNAELLQRHYFSGAHEDFAISQSKDAIIYVTIVVVFYVAIVLLLIGTNLKAGRVTRGARFKQHVVEYTEGNGAANRLVPSSRNGGSTNGQAVIGADQEDDIVEV
eukprot:12596.XXX_533412_535134_1 [CDS] Oithona nana genome sequencing.